MTAVAIPPETSHRRSEPWFTLPESLIALEPVEAHGLERDQVRLLVSDASHDSFVHRRFTDFPDFVGEGDVVVVNSSATLNAALDGTRADGEKIEVHLSQRLFDDRWAVELRRITERGTEPLQSARAGEVIGIPDNGDVTLLRPYVDAFSRESVRLWVAAVKMPDRYTRYLAKHGFPIRYGYAPQRWPLACHQTIFARTPGSAEMPSAGRPFSRRVVDALTRKGVTITSILLHAGVSSPEDHEPPYPEYYRIDTSTARIVNAARDRGSRVIAVGTTVVRALETVTNEAGRVTPRGGWTGLVVTPDRPIRSVDAMLTGFHEPHASHLAMLEALAGRQHIERAYAEAIRCGYRWHEFGDVHLILPGRPITPI